MTGPTQRTLQNVIDRLEYVLRRENDTSIPRAWLCGEMGDSLRDLRALAATDPPSDPEAVRAYIAAGGQWPPADPLREARERIEKLLDGLPDEPEDQTEYARGFRAAVAALRAASPAGSEREASERIDDRAFSGFLILMMCADPWPVNDETAASILAFANDEARRRGFDYWSTALHDPGLAALAAPPAENTAAKDGEA